MTKEIEEALKLGEDIELVRTSTPKIIIIELQSALRTLAAAYRDEKAITDKLPKTADGVAVFHGDRVWPRKPEDRDDYCTVTFHAAGEGGFCAIKKCHSTREAALAARTQEKADGK